MDPREQIKSKLDIVAFIAEHIPLKQMGRNFKALCPFHGEKTPSFVVSPERQIWHCFGCNLGGDVFTFLMEYEKMDFVEALGSLAKRTGVKLTTFTPGKSDEKKERLLGINHIASEFYHYVLTSHPIGKIALSYLKKRGIKGKTIDTFGIGFAPNKWELLVDYLTKKKGFTLQEVEEAGLIIKSQNYYDRFRNRVMFTLRDHRGNVVGFAGRLLEGDAKEAKYVNTPETLLYHKGELFYGLDLTKEAIKKENQAIIVEGEFDMLSSFQAGVANVVALKGTALTEMQAKLVRRFTQNIGFAFDIDIAGDAAARRAIEVADRHGLNIKVICAKDGKDPDEVIRKSGISAWKKAIKEAVSLYDFLIDSAGSRFDRKTPEGKKAIADEVLPTVAAISNEIVKAHFVKRLSNVLDVSEEAIERQFAKLPLRSGVAPSVSLAPEEKKRDRRVVLEEYFLALLLQKGEADLLQNVGPKLDSRFFQSSVLQRIFEKLCLFYDKHVLVGKRALPFRISAFVQELPKELIPTVDRLYLLDTEAVPLTKLLFELERVIREIKALLLKGEMEKITSELKQKEKKYNEKIVMQLKKKFLLYSSQLHALTTNEQSTVN